MAHHETLEHPHGRLDHPPLEINVRRGMAATTSHNDHHQHFHLGYHYQNDHPKNAKQIIDGVNHAVTQSQRHYALQVASQAFHHKDEQLHNYEYDLGAIHALCLKLGYVLLQASKLNPCSLYGEITTICNTLKVVLHGCSLDRQEHSFYDIGQSELIPLLTKILGHRDSISSVRTVNNGDTHDTDNNLNYDEEQRHEIHKSRSIAIYRTMQLLRVFSKLDIAKHYMIHSNEKCLIHHIIEICSALTTTASTTTGEVSHEIRIEGIALIKDLSFRSSQQDKTEIVSIDGLIGMLIDQCSWPSRTQRQQQESSIQRPANTANGEQDAYHTKGREYVSAIFWNLALSSDASHRMSASFDILNVLIFLMTTTTPVNGVRNTTKTRRNATSALGNLATISNNLNRLLTHDNGALVLGLIQVTEKDADTDCRRRAMRTLRCLTNDSAIATSDRTTMKSEAAASGPVQLVLQTAENFISFLLHKIQYDSDLVTKIQACETMGHVARQVVVPAKVQTLLTNIVETTTESKFALVACRALTLCIKHSSETSESPSSISSSSSSLPIFSHNFFQALETLVKDMKDQDAHVCFSELFTTILHKDGADNNDQKNLITRKQLTCESALNSLTILLTMNGTDFEESRMNALHVVTNLVTTEENIRPMAEHDALLTALVSVALASPEGETKDEAKAIILKLVPQL